MGLTGTGPDPHHRGSRAVLSLRGAWTPAGSQDERGQIGAGESLLIDRSERTRQVMHPDRAGAERCGALVGGTPDLVRLDEVRPAVYRGAWSLSNAASGRLRRPPQEAGPRQLG